MNKQVKPVFLTEKGLKEIEDELKELRNVKRPEVIEALKEARALGDLSENADYDAARDAQAVLEGRIKELENIIDNCEIIEKKQGGDIQLGSCVKIKYSEDGEIECYDIVGSQEADPFENKISNESKLAEAIIGKKIGDKVIVTSPDGGYEIEIVEVC